jgi:hypothetical protein
VQYAWDRHDRLSVISALSVSPRRRKIGMYFRVQQPTVCAEDLMGFVRQLHGQLGGPDILVWDRSGPHRKATRLLLRDNPAWLRRGQ